MTNRRKVGTTSNPHAPYVLGYTRATMACTTGSEGVTRSQSLKTGLSSDCRLQLAYMKPESLVIADQHCRGEYVPGPCTHRPSHHESRQHPKPVGQPIWMLDVGDKRLDDNFSNFQPPTSKWAAAV